MPVVSYFEPKRSLNPAYIKKSPSAQ